MGEVQVPGRGDELAEELGIHEMSQVTSRRVVRDAEGEVCPSLRPGAAGIVRKMTSPYQPAPQDPPLEPGAQQQAQHSGYLMPSQTGYVPPTAPAFAPAPVYRYPASTLHAGIRGAIGGVLIVAAVISAVFGNMFPYNAPVEQIMNFGLILVLAGAGATMLIFAALTISKMSRPTVPGRTSPLAITGLVLTAIGVLGVIFFSLLPSLSAISDGDRLRFMTLAAGPFFLGFVWVTGLVMGALSLRAVGGKSRLFGVLAVVIGFLVVIASVVPAVLYGLALTD